MNDERKPLVSDDIIIMHMHRANGDMDLCDRIRQEYEDLIASGKLRVVKEVELWHPTVPEDEWRQWLTAPDPVFTMLVTKCCGRNPWTPPWLVGKETRNRYVCPGCGNPIKR